MKWRFLPFLTRAFVVALVVTATGCARPAPDATPDGALRIFLEKMEASSENPRAMRDAYELLGPEARKNLEERARRSGQLQGRRVEPYEMLAAGRFGLRFRPKSMHVNAAGDRATVDVQGDDAREHASVRCVREGAGWRVEPELPEPAPATTR